MKKLERAEEREIILPEHPVERIVAMIPYPSIYKARCLSKSWFKKFSSVASVDSDVEKKLAVSFQKKVCELSKDWPRGIYTPVLLGKEFLPTEDWVCQKRVILPSLEFLPKEFLTTASNLCSNGILLRRTVASTKILYVAHIFNQSWKKLRRRPNGRARKEISPILVIDKSMDTYKVLVFCGQISDYTNKPWLVQIYDSKLGAWTSKTVLGSECASYNRIPAYLHGYLFIAQSGWRSAGSLLRFNLEEGTSEELKLANADKYFGTDSNLFGHHLVVCNAELFMIVMEGSFIAKRILKLDLVSLQFLEVTGPLPTRFHIFSGKPFSDGRYIFFPIVDDGVIHAYNVAEDKWSLQSRQMASEKNFLMCFQPGWNHCLAL